MRTITRDVWTSRPLYGGRLSSRGLATASYIVLLAILVMALVADSMRQPAKATTEKSRPTRRDATSSNETKAHHSYVPRKCRNKEVLKGHIDNDRKVDFVFHDYLRSGARLGVCTGSGKNDRIQGSGQTELLALIDVEPDGRHEILFGGTTMSAEGYDAAVFRRGRLARVRASNEDPQDPYDDFFVAQGEGLSPLRSKQPIGSAFGCQNTVGGDAKELVQSAVFRAGKGRFRWLKVSYRLEGATATPVAKKRGSFPSNSKKRDRVEVVARASGLVSPCSRTEGSLGWHSG